MAERHHILIVDDETVSLDLLYRNFTEEYRVSTTTTGQEALEIISQGDVDLIITDQRMPGMTGIDLLTRVMKTHPHVIKIILTAYTDAGALLSAINSGCVYKFVTKPWEPQELKLIVKRALEHYDTARENARLYEELKRTYDNLKKDYSQLQKEVARRTLADRIVGTSPATQEVFSQIEKISGSNITVLITGETGTGKELLAKTIHENSPRGKNKFIIQNCGSIPDTLLESELFGHKKGAFTGAIADKKGLLETADGGTIFLDEIGETSPAMQIRLLRFLQEGEIRAVGSEETKKVDARIISATNKDLLEETKKKTFRLDLYYRLNTYSIAMPPLRDRREDIPLLARYFLDEFNRKQLRLIKGFSQEALNLLISYHYPGNIRELENEIERAATLAEDGGWIHPEHFSNHMKASSPDINWALKKKGTLQGMLETLERRAIEITLAAHDGNKTKAALDLGLSRLGLRNKISRYGLDRDLNTQ